MSESEDNNSVASIEEEEEEEDYIGSLGDDADNLNMEVKPDDVDVDDEDDEDDEDDDEEDDTAVPNTYAENKSTNSQNIPIDNPVLSKDILIGSDSSFKFDSTIEEEDGDESNEEDLNTVDDDDDDMLPMDKMDFDVKEDYLANYHPEKMYHNYDEVYNLSKVTRNKNNEIIDDLHKTLPILTKYEFSKILGFRASQLNNGSKPFITLDDNIIDSFVIAKMELQEKKLPFIIRRPLPNGSSEYWKVVDLEIV